MERIHNWLRQWNVTEMKSYLGYAPNYHKFIKGFASIASLLNKLLQQGEVYAWDDAWELAFKTLEAILVPYPDFSKQIILNTDATDTDIGAVISQIDDANKERPIAFLGRTLSKPLRRYSVARKELLALVAAVQQFRVYSTAGRLWLALITQLSCGCRASNRLEGRRLGGLSVLPSTTTKWCTWSGLRHSNADAIYPILWHP